LRAHARPVIARSAQGSTLLDLRAVDADDDSTIEVALRAALDTSGR